MAGDAIGRSSLRPMVAPAIGYVLQQPDMVRGGSEATNMRIILMLHAVDETRSFLSVSPGTLASLIHAVRASGHAIVSLHDLLANGPATDKAVAFTFDDGALSVGDAGEPILRDLGVPATVFLPTGYVGSTNGWPSRHACPPRFPLMSWDRVERLFAAGHAIEAHSVSHRDLRSLTDDELEEELAAPVEEIGRRLGKKPTILAYPYGHHDNRVVSRAQEHYRHAVTTVFRSLAPHDHPLRIPRLDAAHLRSPGIQRLFGDNAVLQTFLRAQAFLRREA